MKEQEIQMILAEVDVTGDVWQAFMAVIADIRREANENCTTCAVPAEERAWWAGFEKATQEIPDRLEKLRLQGIRNRDKEPEES